MALDWSWTNSLSMLELLLDLMEMCWSPTEVTRSRTHLLPWISGLPRRRPSKKTTLWSIPSPTKPASVKTLHAVTLTQLQDEITGLQMDLRLKNQPTKLSQTERGEFPTLWFSLRALNWRCPIYYTSILHNASLQCSGAVLLWISQACPLTGPSSIIVACVNQSLTGKV